MFTVVTVKQDCYFETYQGLRQLNFGFVASGATVTLFSGRFRTLLRSFAEQEDREAIAQFDLLGNGDAVQIGVLRQKIEAAQYDESVYGKLF